MKTEVFWHVLNMVQVAWNWKLILQEGLKRGDITTSSFAFTIDSDTWTKKDNGSYIRTINKFKELFDVSPVYKEAYPDTSVALRKLESFDKEDLTDYYMELRHKLQ